MNDNEDPRVALLRETQRIMAAIAKVVDGEDPTATCYALLAIAAHCAKESGLSREAAAALFQKTIEKAPWT